MTLEGRFVRLEPLELRHLEALFEVAADPELWRWTTNQVRTIGDLEGYIHEALVEQAAGKSLPFATMEVASGGAVGSTRFGNIALEHARLEIGWTWIGRAWQRTAINTEAKLLMLTHAFEVLDCRRVEFKTDGLNTRSREAILRLGAVEEGIFRSHQITHSGRSRDTVWYSITVPDWPTVRRALEGRLAHPPGS